MTGGPHRKKAKLLEIVPSLFTACPQGNQPASAPRQFGGVWREGEAEWGRSPTRRGGSGGVDNDRHSQSQSVAP